MSVAEIIIEVLSWAAILTGGASLIIGSIGILRFPDFWARLHAASVTDSAGVILLIVGMCLQAGPTLVTVKLIIIGLFLFVTGPTATHAVANAAYVSGLRPEGDVDDPPSRAKPRKQTKKTATRAARSKPATKTASRKQAAKKAPAKKAPANKAPASKTATRKPRAKNKGEKS